MMRTLPLAAAVILIIVTSVVQGVWSERFGAAPELGFFAAQLKNIPLEFGDWRGQAVDEPNEKIKQVAGIEGSFSTIYRNARDEQISVFLVCGRLNDLFYHTPERCYPASGFETMTEKSTEDIAWEDQTASFFSSVFRKADPGGTQNVKVYWSWCASGPWIATDDEKWTFRGQRALYKLYVVYPLAGRQRPGERDPAVHFIRDFLPQLAKALDPALARGSSPAAAPPTAAPANADQASAR